MDIRKIKKLIELVEKSSISKLEISEGTQTIRIMRMLSTTLSPISLSSIKKEPDSLSDTIDKKYDNYSHTAEEYIVRSPIVGVFYKAPHFSDKPFVSIGQSINIGDTLCIIEAMKVMNHIQSDKAGIIQSVLVNDGQPVEFDEPLLVIKQKKEIHVK